MKPNIAALKRYIQHLPDNAARLAFAEACGTSLNYLRKCMSRQHFVPDAALCIAIERETGGKVRCEVLRPDADWSHIRKTDCPIPKQEAA